MSRTTSLIPALAVTVAVALSGCSLAQEAPPAHPSFGGDVVELAWTTSLQAVSQPVVVDGVAVVIVQERESELDIVGLDVMTGEEKWRYPYSPGGRNPAYSLEPTVVSDGKDRPVVVFQRPPGDLQQNPTLKLSIAAVDIATGELVSESEPRRLETSLTECIDGHDACGPETDDADTTLRLSVATGEITDIPEVEEEEVLPAGVTSAFFDLYFIEGNQTEGIPGKLGRVEDGKKVWEQTTEILFPTDTPFVKFTWYIEESADVVFVVITEYDSKQNVTYQNGGTTNLDLREPRVVAIDRATGEVLWEDRGVTTLCHSPGWSGLEHVEVEADAQQPSMRCRMTGERQEAKGEETVYDIETFTAEGIDPRTGETSWSLDIDPQYGRAFVDTAENIVMSPVLADSAVVKTDGEMRLFSPETGETTEIPAGQVFLCGTTRDYEYSVTVNGQRTRETGVLAFPCTADGEPTDQPLTDAMLRHIAVPAGEDTFLYANEDGLLGYTLNQNTTILGIELPF